ncbi:MAG: ACT domain-containing protein [Candidatus Hermodarchaeota archaeon]
MSINQISVFLPNKPGQLAEFFEVLMDNKIYIRSLTVAETEDYGLLLLLVDQFEECTKLLEERELLYSVTEVVAVRISDNIAALYKIAKLFGSNDVNIDYLYTSIIDDQPLIIFRLDDNENGIKVLKKNGYHVVEEL